MFRGKKIIALITALLMLISIAVPAFAENEEEAEERTQAAVFYVDAENGNDENDGMSEETAWKTVSKAAANIYIPGDRLLFRRGQTFGGTFITIGSGSEESPVVVSAYGEGSDPVLNGKSTMTFIIVNVSNWIIENIEFTAPTGAGILIAAMSDESTENITVRNCSIHDIYLGEKGTGASGISLSNDNSASRLKNITVTDCKIYNVSWGIHCSGITAEDDRDYFVSPDESYNKNYNFENLYIKDCQCGGIVLAAVKDAVVRNCRVIDCATAKIQAYAPLWTRHVDNALIEYCEIAGSTNFRDGMTIDFDGWSVNSTYRYIYSHDNTRFMKSCVYDSTTKNSGNKVFGCVSVNDNRRANHSATSLISSSLPSYSRMANFEFDDSIIVNASPVFWSGTPSPVIKNISFISNGFIGFIQKIINLFTPVENFFYNNISEEEINNKIAEITANLPDFE